MTDRYSQIWIGIFISTAIAVSGLFLSEWIGKDLLRFSKSPISPIMVSIIIGLIIGNTVRSLEQFKGGIQFCIKYVLRGGIILLGIRLGLGEMVSLGGKGLIVVIPCILITLLMVNNLYKKFNISQKLATLIAVGTSICGATAIVATGPTIDASDEEISYAIANITLFGLVAMFLYPLFSQAIFHGHELATGIFLGSSIHETAQVAGAGLIYSEQFDSNKVLDISTITKLTRNTTLVLVIPLLAYQYHSNKSHKEKIKYINIFPVFILGFIAMGLVRTIGDLTLTQSGNAFGAITSTDWTSIIHYTRKTAGILLAVAMAAVGLNTKFSTLKNIGMKPFYFGSFIAVFVGILSITIITIFIM